MPMSGSGATTGVISKAGHAPPGQEPEVNSRASTPGYFAAMRIPLIKGRDFNERDTADAARVAVINETFARQFFPDEDPLGKRLLNPPQPNATPQPPIEIVGVVGDVKHYGLDDKPAPYLYEAHAQEGDTFMSLVVRAEGDPASIIPAVRREVLALDKDQPVFDIKTMDERVSDVIAQNACSPTAGRDGIGRARCSPGRDRYLRGARLHGRAGARTDRIRWRSARRRRPSPAVVRQGILLTVAGFITVSSARTRRRVCWRRCSRRDGHRPVDLAGVSCPRSVALLPSHPRAPRDGVDPCRAPVL